MKKPEAQRQKVSRCHLANEQQSQHLNIAIPTTGTSGVLNYKINGNSHNCLYGLFGYVVYVVIVGLYGYFIR